MKRITIKDIAKLTNVSTSTVSRTLNNTGTISDQLRQKIKEVAAELNFTLNSNAVNFKNKNTKTIALILPEIGMFFTPKLILGISNVLNMVNYRLSIYITGDSVEREATCILEAIGNGSDGILISLSSETNSSFHLEKTQVLEIPIVIIDKSIEQKKYSEVTFDNYGDSKKCVEYLLKFNPNKVLGIFGSEKLHLTKERLKGFIDAIGDTNYEIIHASSSKEAEKLSEKKNLKEYQGIYCMSDEILIGFLSTYNNNSYLNVDKPNIICLSDGNILKFINPNVPFLLHNGELMGEMATDKLLKLINNNYEKIESLLVESKIIV